MQQTLRASATAQVSQSRRSQPRGCSGGSSATCSSTPDGRAATASRARRRARRLAREEQPVLRVPPVDLRVLPEARPQQVVAAKPLAREELGPVRGPLAIQAGPARLVRHRGREVDDRRPRGERRDDRRRRLLGRVVHGLERQRQVEPAAEVRRRRQIRRHEPLGRDPQLRPVDVRPVDADHVLDAVARRRPAATHPSRTRDRPRSPAVRARSASARRRAPTPRRARPATRSSRDRNTTPSRPRTVCIASR